MNILITICARGGSKGISGKNIKLLAGKPLIEYTIELARQFQNKYSNVNIALSTDSKEITDIALLSGLKVPYIRPEFLATDTAGKIEAIGDVLLFYENQLQIRYDYVLDLDVTSPLRNINDLSKAFQLIKEDNTAFNLFSVNPANRNPYFNMVEQQENGYYNLVKKGEFLTRQSAPKVYDLNASFYFYKRVFFDCNYKTVINPYSLIYIMPHSCFDLDHQIDFEFIEYLMVNKKLDFDL
jgi:CMP-N-acetylneuraminic acid synthetase